jgi:hypothetical protein
MAFGIRNTVVSETNFSTLAIRVVSPLMWFSVRRSEWKTDAKPLR